MRAPTARQAALGVDLVAVLVAGSVAVALASLTWHMLGHTGDGGRVVAAISSVPAAPLDLTPVMQFAPFGTAVVGPAPGVAGDPAVLGMQLRGVLLARPASASTALISTTGAPVQAYAIGAALPGGAILDGIEYDLVTLRVNGQLQTLGFPAKPGGSSASSVFAPAPTSIPASPGASPLETLRARVNDNPRGLLDSLGATATPEGYRVGAGASETVRKLGLQPGDVVEKVNGVALGDVSRDKQVFDAAVASGFARVDVIRDGQHLALSFPLR